MRLLSKFYTLFFEKRLYYLFWSSKVTVERGGVFKVGRNVSLKKCDIYVKKGDCLIIGDRTSLKNTSISMIIGEQSEVRIGENCTINEFDLSLTNGHIHIGNYNKLERGNLSVKPYIEVDGALTIGNYNRLRCSVWLRFQGQVSIGSRNAINEGTELRCDEQIKIGDYNQISYDCVFWDTNTHNLYKAEKRRTITDNQYPDFGLEFEKPKTSPILVGSDCWLGKGVSVLKGVRLGDKCVLGYGTLVSNITIADNKTVFNQPNLKIIDNEL